MRNTVIYNVFQVLFGCLYQGDNDGLNMLPKWKKHKTREEFW